MSMAINTSSEGELSDQGWRQSTTDPSIVGTGSLGPPYARYGTTTGGYVLYENAVSLSVTPTRWADPPRSTIDGWTLDRSQGFSEVFSVANISVSDWSRIIASDRIGHNVGERARVGVGGLTTEFKLDLVFSDQLSGYKASIDLPVSYSIYQELTVGSPGRSLQGSLYRNIPLTNASGVVGGYLTLLGLGEPPQNTYGLPDQVAANEVHFPELLLPHLDNKRFYSVRDVQPFVSQPLLSLSTPLWGVVTSERIPGPKHIIALSHGFRPGGNPSDPNYLESLLPAIRTRLVSEGVSLEDVEFIHEEWGEANVGSLPSYAVEAAENIRRDYPLLVATPALFAAAVADETDRLFNAAYQGSYRATRNAGRDLASKIANRYEELSSDGIPPTIHMIGHSLGSVVNAYAVDSLYSRGIKTDLVTILDSPKEASSAVAKAVGIIGESKQVLAGFDDALLFWKLMPEGSVDFVENLYGNDLIEGTSPVLVFGQPIAGTTPCVSGGCYGLLADGKDHNLWRTFYEPAISGQNVNPNYEWKTPALDGPAPYPSSQRWRPDGLLDTFVTAINNLSDTQVYIYGTLVTDFTGNSNQIDSWQRHLGTIAFDEQGGVRATSNSPSAFSATTLVDDILGVEFTYAVSGATTGILSLVFENEELWRVDLGSANASLSDTVYVSMEDVFGRGDLVWLYDSEELGSSAYFSKISFVRVVPVPEPPSLVLVLTLGGVLRNSRRERRVSRCPR
jgi:hypothetical protein